MNRIIAAMLAASTVAVSGGAYAQARIETTIRSGTPVVLRTAETVTTDAQLKVGRTFALELAQPIEADGRMTIPAGTSATATIVSVKPETAGKPGRIVARLQELRFADRRIRLAGGLEGTGMGLGSIPAGLTVRGYIDEDVMPDRAPMAIAAAPREVVVVERPVVAVVEKPVVVAAMPAAGPDPILVKRDPALTVVAKGAQQGSPALVALAPATAVTATPTAKVETVATSRAGGTTVTGPARVTSAVKVVRVVKKADGVVDQGGVVTRYTY
jgi:hypothetical protein